MATVSNRYMAVDGPMKREVIHLTAVTNNDTVTTNMANPRFVAATDNTGGLTNNTSATISGKTVTVTNASYAGAGVCVLQVYGF